MQEGAEVPCEATHGNSRCILHRGTGLPLCGSRDLHLHQGEAEEGVCFIDGQQPVSEPVAGEVISEGKPDRDQGSRKRCRAKPRGLPEPGGDGFWVLYHADHG